MAEPVLRPAKRDRGAEHSIRTLKETLLSWTVMESLVGVVGLVCVLGLSLVV